MGTAMAVRDYIPSRDADLVTWSNNFSTKIATLAPQIGLTALQASAFAALNTAWVDSYMLATSGITRSPGNISKKNDARTAMKAEARVLVGVVQKHPGLDNSIREELLITVPKQRAPIPAPSVSPEIDILEVNGTTVKVRLHNEALGRRGKPDGVIGASIFSKVAETQPPLDPTQWNFEGNTGKTEFDVAFPESLTPGTKVWITAFWFSPSKESGPGTMPVPATLNYASSISAMRMKMAA
jgi:hypothetical protein